MQGLGALEATWTGHERENAIATLEMLFERQWTVSPRAIRVPERWVVSAHIKPSGPSNCHSPRLPTGQHKLCVHLQQCILLGQRAAGIERATDLEQAYESPDAVRTCEIKMKP